MEKEKEALLRYIKKINSQNKILIPKAFIDKHGREYYMEIYEDKMVLIPKKDEEK